MSGRFAVSPFRNVQANVAKKEQWFTELPLSSTSASESSNAAKATEDYAIVRGSSAGSLLFLPHSKPGKYGQKAASWAASGRTITDFDASSLEPLIAVASEDGRISISDLPGSGIEESASIDLAQRASFDAPTQKAVEVVQFHPTASSIILAAQGPSVHVWDIQSGASRAALDCRGPDKGHWSASWSQDGRLVQTAAKDNTLNLWDLRASSGQPSATAQGHQGFNKASRITSVGDLVLTTGFTKTRDRECSLWDPRNFVKPLTTTRIDTNTGVLMPLVDQARKIVYLVGRSDMTLRWVEITSNTSMTSGNTPLPAASMGAALLPSTSSTLNVMQAEVGKMVILTPDSVLPATLQVPRRNYLDFHNDLYPAQPAHGRAAQSAADWLGGQDVPLDLVTPQPGKAWAGEEFSTRKPAQAPSQKSQEPAASVPTQPVSQEKELASSSASVRPNSTVAGDSDVTPPSAQLQRASLSSPSRAVNVAATATPPSQVSTAATIASQAANGKESTPKPSSTPRSSSTPKPLSTPALNKPAQAVHWSRSFLAGKTALKPDYDDVHGVSSTMNASVQLLKANSTYIFYPLSGPGGRLAIHAVAEKGRLPTHPPTLAAGSEIVDFTLDPFDPRKVYIASVDAKIRILEVPGSLQGDFGDAKATLEDSADKLNGLECSPSINGLILSISEERSEGIATIWNTISGQVLAKITIPGKGIHSAAWDALSTRIAFTCKDRKLRVLDPRKAASDSASDPSTILIGSSHDSVRPSKVVWADDTHLITSGFSKTAFREVAVHRISGDKLETLSKTSIDISPSPLFPYYDHDTNILFAYSKGERTCHAYEVQPASADKSKILTKLPSFDHSMLQAALSFQPKQTVDVKKVEIAKAYRLTPSSIQLVSFVIPRAKMDYFQDDIYPATLEKLQPSSVRPEEWMGGAVPEPAYIDMKPDGMPIMSEAAPPPPKPKTQIFAKQMSEEESSKQYFDNLFKNKQAEVDSDEDDERIRRRNATADDDDW